MEKAFIPNTENKYAITSDGDVISYRRYPEGKILKPHMTEHGYLSTTIKIDGKFKNFYIHRLVATVFVPNPDNLPYVNHKSENRTDNRAENLEWCTAEYNCNFGNHRENLIKATKKFTGHPSRVLKLDSEGNTLYAYYSIKEAARDVAGDNWNSVSVQISKILKGVRGHHTAAGFRWKQITDEEYVQLLIEHEEWMPSKTQQMRLKNYKIAVYIDKTVRKYNPKTGEYTVALHRELYNNNSANSVMLF